MIQKITDKLHYLHNYEKFMKNFNITVDIRIVGVSQAYYDPDFDLAEGSRQVFNICIDFVLII